MFLVRTDGSGLRPLDLRIDGIGGPHDFTHGMDWSVDGSRFAYVLPSRTISRRPTWTQGCASTSRRSHPTGS